MLIVSQRIYKPRHGDKPKQQHYHHDLSTSYLFIGETIYLNLSVDKSFTCIFRVDVIRSSVG